MSITSMYGAGAVTLFEVSARMAGAEVVIAPKRDRKLQRQYDADLY